MSKIGRNDPCPCGSGKKFKRCCVDMVLKQSAVPPPEVVKAFYNAKLKEQQRLQNYGHVKPVISADFKGHKFIAVGSTLHASKNWKTLPDFLNDYVKLTFGKEWWKEQFTKPESERSPVCRWCSDAYEYAKNNSVKEGDLYGVEPSGPHLAYLSLGYDLYILKHHQLLQQEAIKRMKRTPEFHGARYELLVAATFIRAGFDIRYEDEKDNTSKHPEFVATHRATGIEFDVEAKKRNRVVKLDKDAFKSGNAKIAVRDLLASATGKFRGRPYIIFLDLDVPPIEGNPLEQPWFTELRETPEAAGARGGDGKDIFNMVSFSNLPVEYTKDVPSFFRHIDMVSLVPKVPISSPQPLTDLRKALDQFGQIPSHFEDS